MNETEIELRKRIDELEKENCRLEMEVLKAYRNDLMAKLIFSSADFDLSREDFKRLTNVKFKGDAFFVIAFHEKRRANRYVKFNDDGRITLEGDKNPSYEDMEKLIMEAIPPRYTVLTAKIYGQIYCVVNYQKNAGESKTIAEKDLVSAMEHINAKMMRLYGFVFLIAVSGLRYGQSGITEAAQDCAMIDDYRRFLEAPEQEVLLYSWFRGINPAEDEAVVSTQKLRFARCINNCDYEAARKILNEEMLPRVRIADSNGLAMNRGQNKFTESFISIVMGDSGITADYRAEQSERILRAGTVTEMAEVMNDILIYLSKKRSINTRLGDDLGSRIRDYIEAEYRDPDLDVNSVAEHFGITPSHASKVYKNCCGSNMSQDIQALRVDAAKALLQKRMPIKEIADSVGFRNSSNFIRVFKKLEGTTPGKVEA